VPEFLHQHDPNFVPAFPGSIAHLLSPNAPFRKIHGEIFPFIAYRDGKPVGRIAAIINHSHNRYYDDKVGFFGFFDVIDDQSVAKSLVNKAQEILLSRGCKSMRGPYSPTVNDECGLLVDGFETPPMMMMPYNPAYYLPLYSICGLEKARDLFAYYIPGSTVMPERIEKIVARLKRNSGLSLRSIDLKNLDEELKIIQRLYNDTLNRNWGFVPITYEDLLFSSKELKEIADPEMLLIAEKEGVAVGFAMLLPNINEFLLKARNLKGWRRLIKLIWMIKTKHPKEARLALLGVEEKYRNSGIAAMFYYETLSKGRNKFVGGELSWIEESNQEMIRGIAGMGAKHYKSYRIYEKPIHGTIG